jgi:hypothetical protein
LENGLNIAIHSNRSHPFTRFEQLGLAEAPVRWDCLDDVLATCLCTLVPKHGHHIMDCFPVLARGISQMHNF